MAPSPPSRVPLQKGDDSPRCRERGAANRSRKDAEKPLEKGSVRFGTKDNLSAISSPRPNAENREDSDRGTEQRQAGVAQIEPMENARPNLQPRGAVSERKPSDDSNPKGAQSQGGSQKTSGQFITGQLLSQEIFLTFSNTASIEMIRRDTPNRKRRFRLLSRTDSRNACECREKTPEKFRMLFRQSYGPYRQPPATIIGEFGRKDMEDFRLNPAYRGSGVRKSGAPKGSMKGSINGPLPEGPSIFFCARRSRLHALFFSCLFHFFFGAFWERRI